jgi:hypothetical protein
VGAGLGRERGHVPPEEENPSGVGAEEAGDHVEKRALARSVGADDPQDLPLLQVEAYPLEGLEAKKRLPISRTSRTLPTAPPQKPKEPPGQEKDGQDEKGPVDHQVALPDPKP